MVYKWKKLKTKFITGEYKSLKDFAGCENIPYQTLRINARGWIDEKSTKDQQKQNKITDKIIANQADRAALLNEQYIDIAELAMGKVKRVLCDELEQSIDMFGKLHNNRIVSEKKLKTVIECLTMLQKTHRLALGMDKEEKCKDAEPVNLAKQVKIIHIDTDMSDDDINNLLKGEQ